MKSASLTSAMALVALCTSQAAQAQTAAAAPCVAPADLFDTITYAMPIAYDAVQTKCGSQYSEDSFMLSEGDAFAERFRVQQDQAWPGTLRLLKIFMNRETERSKAADAGIQAMIDALPEDSLRPFVDGFIEQMIFKEIKLDSCDKIARGVELLSPLPAENVAGLITFTAEFADLKNPELCKPAPEPELRE
ncbi:MAG: hypothetical protein AAF494_04950 [Pseudomonadota bacterium]